MIYKGMYNEARRMDNRKIEESELEIDFMKYLSVRYL